MKEQNKWRKKISRWNNVEVEETRLGNGRGFLVVAAGKLYSQKFSSNFQPIKNGNSLTIQIPMDLHVPGRQRASTISIG